MWTCLWCGVACVWMAVQVLQTVCVSVKLSAVLCWDQTVHSPCRAACRAGAGAQPSQRVTFHLQHSGTVSNTAKLYAASSLPLPSPSPSSAGCIEGWQLSRESGLGLLCSVTPVLCGLCALREDFCSSALLFLAARGKCVLKSVCVYVSFFFLSSSRG